MGYSSVLYKVCVKTQLIYVQNFFSGLELTIEWPYTTNNNDNKKKTRIVNLVVFGNNHI